MCYSAAVIGLDFYRIREYEKEDKNMYYHNNFVNLVLSNSEGNLG